MIYFNTNSEGAAEWVENAVRTEAKKKLALSTIATLLSKIDGNKNKIGWATATSYSEGAGLTKFCLIVASHDQITIGIHDGSKQQASPGRTWQQLAPWKPDSRGFEERLRCWVDDKKADRVTIALNQKAALVKTLRMLHRKQSPSDFSISRNEAYLDGVNKSGKRSLRVIIAAAEGDTPKSTTTRSASIAVPKLNPLISEGPLNSTVFYEDGRPFRYENGYRIYLDTKPL
jgi:hypothetical protein